MILRPFVGRAAEIAAIDSALGPEGASVGLRVSGPVGIGKSALLFRALQICLERGVPFRRLDPAVQRVDGDAVRAALSELAAETGPPRRVLIIDDVHLARDAERWLVGHLHELGESTTILLGDRQSVSLAWYGGSATPIELPLAPLVEPAITQLFDAYGVSAATRAAAMRTADGNPLLLTLYADGERNAGGGVEEVLLRLAGALFPAYDDASRILVLAVLAIAPAATHELIGRAIGEARSGRGLFRWLRGLSVVDDTRDGFSLHPAARQACSALMRTHHRGAYQRALEIVHEVKEPEPRAGTTSVVVSAWRGGSAAIAVEAEAAAPQFSEMLRGRLDELARQASLTDREREVFELLVLGRSANEMATVLGITTRTVKFHQQRVLDKIGADSRLDILRLLL